MIVRLQNIENSISIEEKAKCLQNMVKGALVEHYGKPLTPDTIDVVAKEIASNISIYLKLK